MSALGNPPVGPCAVKDLPFSNVPSITPLLWLIWTLLTELSETFDSMVEYEMDSGEEVVVECELINRTMKAKSAPTQIAMRIARDPFERPGCCGCCPWPWPGPGAFQRDCCSGGSALMSRR